MTTSPTRSTRGLTLLEVLVSVALLATLASAILPLLRDLSAREPKPKGVPPYLLAQAADALLASKDREALDALPIGETMTRDWPSAISRPTTLEKEDEAITIARKASGSQDSLQGAWWVFSSGGTFVVRYAESPHPKDAER